MIETCVAQGVPIFGLCRGLQEMNVAFGGSLHPEIRELPGRMNHRMPRLAAGEVHPDPAIIFADRHEVSLVPDGVFARLIGYETIRVNSLNGQGILKSASVSKNRMRGHLRRDCSAGKTARALNSMQKSRFSACFSAGFRADEWNGLDPCPAG